MEKAKEILKILNEYGNAYIVGGSVRDILLDRPCDDIDIATNVPMEKIEELFDTYDIGANKTFGVSVVNYKGSSYEIANFRKDGQYSDGRRPDSVEIIDSFKEDSMRRDFTINGLGMDVDGNIIDYVNGQKDIKNETIKCIGNPYERFGEDYLRMLRAVRFSSTLGFELEEKTFHAIFYFYFRIDIISKERIQKELWKMASQSGKKFADALRLLKETQLLYTILPEINCMDEYEHKPEHHPEGNVWEHTLKALESYEGNDPIVNFSILFHDIGKPISREYNERGVSYHGHAHEGVAVAENVLKRLKFSNDAIETITFCVQNHMKFWKFEDIKDNKILKLMNDKNWNTLYKVAYADDICRIDISEFRSEFDNALHWDNIDKKIERLHNKFIEDDRYKTIKKTVNGILIMTLTGLEPSPEVGRIQRETIDWIIDNDVDTLYGIEIIKQYIMTLGVEITIENVSI